MFGFFRSSVECPVAPEEQRWIDGRFEWLREQFEDACKTCQVILPTPEFFPDRYEGKPEDVQPMLARISGAMGVDAARFKLFFYSERNPFQGRLPGSYTSHGSAGVYLHQPGRESDAPIMIGLEESRLADPLSLVATLAHEIGHELLLGQGRVRADEHDHEPLTDLLTVFLGLGIFTANSTIRDRAWSSGGWSGWSTSRLGYLGQPMFGYALARFAFTRGETDPPWLKHVRPDVRSPLRQGLRFLSKPSP